MCMYACMNVRFFAFMYASIHARMSVLVHVYVERETAAVFEIDREVKRVAHARACACACVRACVRVYVCVCVGA